MATKAQQTYEQVNKLVEGGTPQAQAFKDVAAERGQSVDSIRGAYYAGRKQSGETPPGRKPRRRTETTPEDAIAAAIASLEKSVAAIQQDVADADERVREAEAEYRELSETSGPKIAEIESKIAALRGDGKKKT